jgi:hypothetical protein
VNHALPRPATDFFNSLLAVQQMNFSEMTPNERLVAAGLLDTFDNAAHRRDRVRLVELLSRVELADQADQIADAILAEPKRYGF